MNYRSKSNGTPLLRWGIFCCVVACVYGLVHYISGPLFSTTARAVVAQQTVFSRIETVFTQKEDIMEQNMFLREKIEQMKADQYFAGAQQQWYQELQKEISPGSVVTAQVLVGPPRAGYDRLIIDAGLNQGILPGQLVTKYGQYVLGYVDHVEDNFARVVLFSSPDVEYMGSIDGYQFIMRGSGGGSARAQLRRDFQEHDQATVRIPGSGGRILGEVTSTQLRPQDSFRTAVITLPFNILSLETVTVVADTYKAQQVAEFIDQEDEE